MNTAQSGSRFQIWESQFVANLASYLLIGILLVCFTNSVTWLLNFYFPDWNGGYLPWLAFFVSIEALYYRRLLRRKRLSFDDREFWIFRGSELIVIVITTRFLLYVMSGFDSFLEDFQGWPSHWYQFLNNREFFGVSLFILLIWSISNLFGVDIDRLQIRPVDVRWDTMLELDLDRKEARDQLLGRLLILGMIIFLFTLIIRLSTGQYFGESVLSRTATMNVLVYFGVSVILFSSTQFALLRGRWLWEEIEVVGNLGLSWIRYSLIFISLIIFIAFLLPTIYAYGLLESIKFLVGVLGYLVGLVYFLFSALFSLIYGILLVISGGEAKTETIDPPILLLPEPGQASNTQSWFSNPFVTWMFSLGFWLILILVIGGSLVHYLRQQSELYQRIKTIPVIDWALQLFSWIATGFFRLRAQISENLTQSFIFFQKFSPKHRHVIEANYFSLRKLNPREKIIFYYLAFLRRSKEVGLTREPYATPAIFRQKVDPHLPEGASEDTHRLTEAFYTARYSNMQINPTDVIPVSSSWMKLREYLRKLRKNA